MTTVFKNERCSHPQTHVFIIGVGQYSYLINGKEQKEFNNFLRLNQLTSAPNSARMLANWIIENLNNPEAPLGSVEMLLSSSNDQYRPPEHSNISNDIVDGAGTDEITVDRANMNNIKDAFDIWYERCNSHPNNVAIFYFCGHGIEKGNLALLTEDFGANINRQFENSFDFHSTYRGMEGCQARTQCYFVDSCREVPLEILDHLELNNMSLKDPKVNSQSSLDALVLFAASRNSQAWGRTDGITRFTDALIKSLDGLGSFKSAGRWQIRTDKLSTAVVKTIDRSNLIPQIPKQYCKVGGEHAGNSLIHVLSQNQIPPLVPVVVRFIPEKATTNARLRFVRQTTNHTWNPPHPHYWEYRTINAGEYDIHAEFPNLEYANCILNDELIFPPIYDGLIEVY
jgi:hypothetical protein